MFSKLSFIIFQKLINGLLDCRNLSFPTDKVVTSAANCDLKQVPEKIKSRMKLPQSKSDIVINSRKSYIVPRSKSASIPLMPKTSKILCDSKSCSALSPKTSVARHTNSTSNKTSKSVAVISSNDLDKLKNLQLNLPSSHNSKERKVTLSSGNSFFLIFKITSNCYKNARFGDKILNNPNLTERNVA